MKNEYVGTNIKLGSLFVVIPHHNQMIQGDAIYIAKSDGLYYGVGGLDDAIWIQTFPVWKMKMLNCSSRV